jgi:hypothetical protein
MARFVSDSMMPVVHHVDPEGAYPVSMLPTRHIIIRPVSRSHQNDHLLEMTRERSRVDLIS